MTRSFASLGTLHAAFSSCTRPRLAKVLGLNLLGMVGATVHAQTTLPGGTIGNTTWTAAGSPYTVQSDLLVPVGATLNIDPGVTVRFDSGAGLFIEGELAAGGVAGNPICFEGTGGGSGSWTGIRTRGTGTSTLCHARIQDAVIALRVGGLAYLDRVELLNSSSFGVDVTNNGDLTAVNCLVAGSASYGVYLHNNTTASVALVNCTIEGNSYGVYASSSSAGARSYALTNSIVANNTNHGVYEFGSGTTLTVSWSNLWGNGDDGFNGASNGGGNISGNPLFVDAAGADFRLTSNSPSRNGSSDLSDQGAFPYDGVATGELAGFLWSDTTLAAGTHSVTGDLTVPGGVTLTLDPGAILEFATSDLMSSNDPDRTRLYVEGTLLAPGTPANPIVLRSTSAIPGAWEGISLGHTATGSVIRHVLMESPEWGIWHEAAGSNLLEFITIDGADTAGITVAGGDPTIAGLIARNGDAYGFEVRNGGDATLTNALIVNNSSYGIYLHNNTTASVALVNCTIEGNSYGVYASSSSAGARSYALTNSIVANNINHGVYEFGSGTTLTVSWTDLWGNGDDGYNGATNGGNNVSFDPMFNGAPDYGLQFGSPLIDAGDGTVAPGNDLDDKPRPLDGDLAGGPAHDLGAYEFDILVDGPDTDGDTLPDAWETLHGLDPNIAADALDDLDGDGASNLSEFFAFTDPNDRTSVLRLLSILEEAGPSYKVRWSTVPGKYYELKYSVDSINWLPFVPPAIRTATGAELDYTDNSGKQFRRFYQAEILPH